MRPQPRPQILVADARRRPRAAAPRRRAHQPLGGGRARGSTAAAARRRAAAARRTWRRARPSSRPPPRRCEPEPITQSHGPGGGASLPQRSCAHAMRAGSGSRCSFCRIFARCSSASPARPSVSGNLARAEPSGVQAADAGAAAQLEHGRAAQICVRFQPAAERRRARPHRAARREHVGRGVVVRRTVRDQKTARPRRGPSPMWLRPSVNWRARRRRVVGNWQLDV